MCCIMGGMGMMMMMDAAAAAKKRFEEVNPGWTTSHYLQWKIDNNILFFYFCHSTHGQSVSIYDTNLSSLSSLTKNPTDPPQQICFSFGKKFSSGLSKNRLIWFSDFVTYVKLPSLIDSCTFFNSNNYVCCCLLQMCSVLRRLPKERNFAATAGMQSHLP